MNRETTSGISFSGPYPGLRPFAQEDAPRFFGRGRQINQMLERLEEQQFLAVVGASGCGKSSLVNAGLLPALVAGYLMDAAPDWRMVSMRPGDSPLHNLARALDATLKPIVTAIPESTDLVPTLKTLQNGRFGLLDSISNEKIPSSTNILLLVDQFEEIFRYRDKEDNTSASDATPQTKYERQNESIAFVNLLLTAAEQSQRPLFVIITMRSDFLGDCDQFQGLPEAINRAQFLTPRMTRDQLREAIVGPLELFDSSAEPGLVDRILNEIGTVPDQLPLMQHALMRTWTVAIQLSPEDSTAPIRLTVEHYTNPQVGGVEKALDCHASEIYDGFAKLQLAADSATASKITKGEFRDTLNGIFVKPLIPVLEQQLKDISNPEETEQSPSDRNQNPVFKFLRKKARDGIQELLIVTRSVIEPASNPRQRICERMFRCLSDVNSRGRVVRRLATIQEIADVSRVRVSEVVAVAEPFLESDCSFLTASPKSEPLSARTTLDISHEALLRQWKMLNIWIKTERASAEIYRRLSVDAGLFRAGQRSSWRFDDYMPVVRWIEREQPNSDWARRYVHPESQEATFDDSIDFLNLSRHKGARWTFAKIAIFVACVVIGGYGWRLKNFADDKAKEADTKTREANKANVELKDANCKANEAAEDARKVKALTQHNLDLSNAEIALNDDRVAEALIWWLRAYEHAPKEDRASDPVRSLLGGWSRAITTTFVGETGENAIEVSRDGETLMTKNDRQIRFWEMRTGRPRGPAIAHDSNGEFPALWSSDGATALTAKNDGSVQLWDAFTCTRRGQPLTHQKDARIAAAAISPDGKTVLTGARDDEFARLWNAFTSSEIQKFKQGEDVINVKYSRDGKSVLTGGLKTALLWDVETGSLLQEFKPINANHISHLQFSPDEQSILTGIDGTALQLWDKTTGKTLGGPTLHQVEPGKKLEIKFSSDSQKLMTFGGGNAVILWDAQSGKRLAAFEHEKEILSFEFSSDSKTVLTGSRDATARVWDVNSGQLNQTLRHQGDVLTVAFSKDGWTVLTGSMDESGCLWDARTGVRKRPPFMHQSGVRAVRFGADEQTVLTASLDGIVRQWSYNMGSVNALDKAMMGKIWKVWITLNGEIIAVEEDFLRRTARLRNVKTGMILVKPLEDGLENTAPIHKVAISPDRRSVVLTYQDSTARIWDTETGTKRGVTLDHGGKMIFAVAFSHDGKSIVTGGGGGAGNSDRGHVTLWDSQTGKAVYESLEVDNPVSDSPCGLAISSDRQTVLTVTSNGNQLWNMKTREKIGEPLQHDGTLLNIAFSPDCQSVITGSSIAVMVWNAHTGLLIARKPLIRRGRAEVDSIAFSPDGASFITRTREGTIQLWDMQTGVPRCAAFHSASIYFGQKIMFSPRSEMALEWLQGLESLVCGTFELPPPAANEPERLKLSVEVRTGLYFDEKSAQIKTLTQTEWQTRYDRLWKTFKGPCDISTWHQVGHSDE